eukprot:6003406-Pyramimonas_sp.AAC.1
MVLHELCLCHWTPAALHVTPACAFLQHVARQKNWPLGQDLGVERYRDKEREAATDHVLKAQSQWVPNVGPIARQKDRCPYFENRSNFDDIWPWLQEKG